MIPEYKSNMLTLMTTDSSLYRVTGTSSNRRRCGRKTRARTKKREGLCVRKSSKRKRRSGGRARPRVWNVIRRGSDRARAVALLNRNKGEIRTLGGLCLYAMKAGCWPLESSATFGRAWPSSAEHGVPAIGVRWRGVGIWGRHRVVY